jgi:2,3-dihydro-2,3-dihydroxybenzoate dehydrogenase
VVTRIVENWGVPSLLANVAGELAPGAACELTDEAWQRSFAVNATGVMHVSRAVVGRMLPLGRGAVVTVSSNAARVGRMNFAAYAASKAAATAYTRCLALEVAPHGIRCNVVSPGSTDTTMLAELLSSTERRQATIDGVLSEYRAGIPLRRIAEPDDIASVVLFLLSDRARHVCMQDVCVDGGATLGAT